MRLLAPTLSPVMLSAHFTSRLAWTIYIQKRLFAVAANFVLRVFGPFLDCSWPSALFGFLRGFGWRHVG